MDLGDSIHKLLDIFFSKQEGEEDNISAYLNVCAQPGNEAKEIYQTITTTSPDSDALNESQKSIIRVADNKLKILDRNTSSINRHQKSLKLIRRLRKAERAFILTALGGYYFLYMDQMKHMEIVIQFFTSPALLFLTAPLFLRFFRSFLSYRATKLETYFVNERTMARSLFIDFQKASIPPP